MKGIVLVLIIPALFAFSLFTGCAHVGITKAEYQDGIDQVHMGMTQEQFLEIFPDAVVKASKQMGEGIATLVELDVEYHSAGEYARVAYAWARQKDARRIWFYFYRNALVQYGTADSWEAFSPGADSHKHTIGK